MLTMWRYAQTAAWPQPEPQPEPQPDRSSLYINNGDVTQTAAIWIAAVCLGQKMYGYKVIFKPPNKNITNLDDYEFVLDIKNWRLNHALNFLQFSLTVTSYIKPIF